MSVERLLTIRLWPSKIITNQLIELFVPISLLFSRFLGILDRSPFVSLAHAILLPTEWFSFRIVCPNQREPTIGKHLIRHVMSLRSCFHSSGSTVRWVVVWRSALCPWWTASGIYVPAETYCGVLCVALYIHVSSASGRGQCNLGAQTFNSPLIYWLNWKVSAHNYHTL